MAMIYEGCWPFTQNKETGRYRWKFENPKHNHKVLKEILLEYGDITLVVLQCKAPTFSYYAVLGKYLEAEEKIEKVKKPSKEFRVDMAQLLGTNDTITI